MTVTGSTGLPGEVDRASRRAPWKLPAMLVTLGIVLVSVGLWQWRSPDAFGAQGSEAGMYSQVGSTVLIGVATPLREMDPEVLTVHSVEPQITEGDATVDVLVCHTRPGEDRIGAVRGEALDQYCESHGEPEGAKLGNSDDLILRVRSESPGRLVVEGLRVTYSHGWRRGSQLTGLTIKVDFGTETVREHLAG